MPLPFEFISIAETEQYLSALAESLQVILAAIQRAWRPKQNRRSRPAKNPERRPDHRKEIAATKAIVAQPNRRRNLSKYTGEIQMLNTKQTTKKKIVLTPPPAPAPIHGTGIVQGNPKRCLICKKEIQEGDNWIKFISPSDPDLPTYSLIVHEGCEQRAR